MNPNEGIMAQLFFSFASQWSDGLIVYVASFACKMKQILANVYSNWLSFLWLLLVTSSQVTELHVTFQIIKGISFRDDWKPLADV